MAVFFSFGSVSPIHTAYTTLLPLKLRIRRLFPPLSISRSFNKKKVGRQTKLYGYDHKVAKLLEVGLWDDVGCGQTGYLLMHEGTGYSLESQPQISLTS
jgi:hypothetical protein